MRRFERELKRVSWYEQIWRGDRGDITRMVLDKTRKETQKQALHQMDGQYKGRNENIWPSRSNDRRHEDVVKDGGNGRHTLVYKTQGAK